MFFNKLISWKTWKNFFVHRIHFPVSKIFSNFLLSVLFFYHAFCDPFFTKFSLLLLIPDSLLDGYSAEEKTCPHCQRVYRWKKGLDRHLQECGQEPKFGCPFCDHRSKRKENLSKHIIKKHGNHVMDAECLVKPATDSAKSPIPGGTIVSLN